MGNKCSPIVFRLENNQRSVWYTDNRRDYAKFLMEDYQIRSFITKNFADALVSHIEIKRLKKRLEIDIHACKTSVLIGSRGENAKGLGNIKDYTRRLLKTDDDSFSVSINVVEVKDPDANAEVLAQKVAKQIEMRTPVKKALRNAVQTAMKISGVQGANVIVNGRINGTEIAREEKMREGRLPMQTKNSLVLYGKATAFTTYGALGIKVFICKKHKFSDYS